MNKENDERLRKLLRSAIAPLENPELKRDLWPLMLRKLDERPIRADWLDWALAALVMLWCFVFPEVIAGLLYHL